MPEDPTAAVQLSPEFLAGSTEAGLEKIRTRLLDLTARNRLLNFRHTTASSLRVVEADIDSVFRGLLDGEKFTFDPVPEPPEYPAGQKPTPLDYAKEIGWPTSFDLEELKDWRGNLSVLHYAEQLETLTRKIGSAAKTAIEESGANMLHLVMGYLEWYESEDSQQPRLAPLVTVPVSLDRSAGRGAAFQCAIEHSGEDLAANLSLVERMRRDFGIDVPVLEADETPAEYFDRFGPILRQKRRWKIKRQMTLTLLSFGKLLMYRDLDPATWPHIKQHPLVRELFEGRRTEAVGPAEEFDIDSAELKAEVPSLILDADSSQHSALIHALRGQNLVIEGPPGTGKSQTISNLIGAALAKGRTVLFVAEKLAALQVVRKRLDDANLGHFCLELHSHKTKKHVFLNDLATRVNARGSFRDPGDLDHVLAGLNDKKRVLINYVGEINRRVHPFDATVFEILWARDRYRQELPFTKELKGHVPHAMQTDRTEYARKQAFLALYGQHLAAVLEVNSDLNGHPWAWLDKPLSFEDEERLTEHLAGLIKSIEHAKEQVELLQTTSGVAVELRVPTIGQIRELQETLPSDAPNIPQKFLSICIDPISRNELNYFGIDIRSARTALTVISKYVVSPEKLASSGQVAELQAAAVGLAEQRLTDRTLNDLRELRRHTKEVLEMLSSGQQAFDALASLLAWDQQFGAAPVDVLLSFLRVIESTPFDVLHLRSELLERDGAAITVREAKEEHDHLEQIGTALSSVCDVSAAQHVRTADLLESAQALETAGLLQVLFGSAVRSARRTHRRLAKTQAKRSRLEMARELRSVAEYRERRSRFETNGEFQRILGPHFRGLDTRWGDFEAVIGWYELVFSTLPSQHRAAEPLRELLLRARAERLRGLAGALKSSARHRETLIRVHAIFKTGIGGLPCALSGSLSEIREELQAFSSSLERHINAIAGAGYNSQLPLEGLSELLAAIDQYRSGMQAATSRRKAVEVLGEGFDGHNTDVHAPEAALQFAGKLGEVALPRRAVEWVLSQDTRTRLKTLRNLLNSAATAFAAVIEDASRVLNLTGVSMWDPIGEVSFETLRQIAKSSLEGREHLAQWVHFVRVQRESETAGLARLSSLADSGHMKPADLVPAFRYLFFDSLARGVFAERPDLANLTGVTVSELRKQFAELDRQAIVLNRQRVASTVDRRPVPYGNQAGPVGSWTDMALLVHEIGKQRRHIPIRQLMRRSGRALQSLKPCFMMGPLSVAQYIAPGELSFDLIVMDEASQLKPEDAIGALARGGQMVIVGDPKQLPPTTFFQRAAIDAETEDDDATRTVAEEGESILDVASTLYQPVRRLRWHYRSRHHSLIAFSNKEFYQGDLVIFPSAFHDHQDLGVKYHEVKGGVFESGRNAREAAVVVDAVLDHMERRPNESLGVVTLNFEQGELIEELLDQRLRAEPFALEFQERMNNGNEPFFVKNLENVQGDERDVIFISATYGADARGNQYQRFGPLNGPNGHRRLNVLFTRAKKRTEVFSSLDPDKIQVGPTSAWGLRVLKQYLGFARSGVLEGPDEGQAQPVNDFELSVGAVLKERGFEVVPQVGVAGFFIDLAIKHPTKRGSYLLGIECDGASYHSGRSVRDRDRLREEILINLGWKIHRIWSTDWFKSRASQTERLLTHVNDLLEADPDYKREEARKARREALRQTLIEIRAEILSEFVGSTNSCLLRDELIEEFMAKRPRTRDDWFRRIPQQLRAGTDSKQVGRFLEKILSAISQAET